MTRHSLATLAALALAGTVLLAACGQDATPPASADATTTTVTTTATTTAATTAATTATHLPATDPLSTEEVQEIFEPLAERAVEVWFLFNVEDYLEKDTTQTMPPDASRNDQFAYCLVTDVRFPSMDSFKAYIEEAYTPECAERGYYSGYLDETRDNPRYRAYEGRLYTPEFVGGKGWSSHYLIDTLVIQEQWADYLAISVECTLPDPSTRMRTFFHLKKTDAGWRLDSYIDELPSEFLES